MHADPAVAPVAAKPGRRAPTARAGIHWMVLATLLFAVPGQAASAREAGPGPAPLDLRVWPGDGLAPGDQPLAQAQRTVERSKDPALPDRYVDRVSVPTMAMYRPEHPNGTALLVIPGGGYQRVVLDKEGTALLPAFVEGGGLTLFVLRYRLPGEGHKDGADTPFADAQRALRSIRANAAQWGVDPHRIGVMGFSAGGHVAASLGTRQNEPVHAPVDEVDHIDARPDFQLLVYPVIDMTGIATHAGSRLQLLGPRPSPRQARRYSPQYHVDARTPPTFLLHAQDDEAVPVANSLLFYDALRAAGVPAQMHLFPQGGHGFGIRGTRGLTVAAWPRLALDWINAQGAPQESTP